MNMTTKKESDLGRIKALEAGQRAVFDISKTATIRANAAMINATRNERSLVTRLDRAAGTITVIREGDDAE